MVFTAGVDVGAPAKGFHAVAFKDGKYHSKFASTDADAIAAWCHESGVRSIGVDAPCCWSTTDRQRRAERELSAERISCFATPSEESARSHSKGHYNWMLNGARLFEALTTNYPLLTEDRKPQQPVCFETFPQAIACALAGKRVSARQKGRIRRELLAAERIDTSALTSMDFVDAALCALTAHRLWINAVKMYGDRTEGFIVVPDAKAGVSR